MRRLPHLPRQRSEWRRIGIGAGRVAGKAALQGVGGFVVAFAAYAVADTVPDGMWRAFTQVGVVVGVLGACGVVMWIKTRGGGRRRNPSTDSQTHNLSIHALIRGFRRG